MAIDPVLAAIRALVVGVVGAGASGGRVQLGLRRFKTAEHLCLAAQDPAPADGVARFHLWSIEWDGPRNEQWSCNGLVLERWTVTVEGWYQARDPSSYEPAPATIGDDILSRATFSGLMADVAKAIRDDRTIAPGLCMIVGLPQSSGTGLEMMDQPDGVDPIECHHGTIASEITIRVLSPP